MIPLCQHRDCRRPIDSTRPAHALCREHWSAALSRHIERDLRAALAEGPSRLAGSVRRTEPRRAAS